VLRAFRDEVEVAADPFRVSGQKGGGKLQAGALGELGRGERIADRAQILQLVLGRFEPLVQRGEILIARGDLLAQAHDERVLEVIAIIHVVDVALLSGNFSAQSPELTIVAVGFHAHPFAARGAKPLVSCA
jgi:hypothetical protein